MCSDLPAGVATDVVASRWRASHAAADRTPFETMTECAILTTATVKRLAAGNVNSRQLEDGSPAL